MTQETGACAESTPVQNGLSVKADIDFGAIEVAMTVQGKSIGFFVTVDEALALSEALQQAIYKMHEKVKYDEVPVESPTEETKPDEDKAEENTQ